MKPWTSLVIATLATCVVLSLVLLRTDRAAGHQQFQTGLSRHPQTSEKETHPDNQRAIQSRLDGALLGLRIRAADVDGVDDAGDDPDDANDANDVDDADDAAFEEDNQANNVEVEIVDKDKDKDNVAKNDVDDGDNDEDDDDDNDGDGDGDGDGDVEEEEPMKLLPKKRKHKKKKKRPVTSTPKKHIKPSNLPGVLPPSSPRPPQARVDKRNYLLGHIWAPTSLMQFPACPTAMDLRLVRSYSPADWLSSYVTDVNQCYCASWSYFMSHTTFFHGESGLEYFQKLLVRIGEDFRQSNLNIFANLSPRSKYNMDMLDIMRSQLYIDIGSNPADALRFLQDLEPKGMKFLFFEGNPDKQQAILESMKKEPRLSLAPVVLMDSPGLVSLDSYQFHSFGDDVIEPAVKTGRYANATTLDSYLLEQKLNHIPIPILSIDAEGQDVIILKGATETLSRVRVVIFECHRSMRANYRQGPGTTHYEVQELLAPYGFLSFKMSKAQWVAFTGHWYHISVDTPTHMGWQKCVALRHDDPLLDRVFPEQNSIKACQYNPPKNG